jgi:hypothetical protein
LGFGIPPVVIAKPNHLPRGSRKNILIAAHSARLHRHKGGKLHRYPQRSGRAAMDFAPHSNFLS